MVSLVHHPWRHFRDSLPQWGLVWADLPEGVAGVTDWERLTITLDRRLTQAERRSTICHEALHAHRGPIPDDPVIVAREELAIERLAARKLIGLEALGEALAWSRFAPVVADVLWVDEQLLDARLDHLHPSERAYLHRRLDGVHHP